MRTLLFLAVVASLAGCKEKPAAPPPVRPVLSMVVAPQSGRPQGFTGTVEPRYRVSLGFRVPGRLLSRDVEVGDQIRAGAQVASIESVALEFAVRVAISDVSSARAQLVNTSGAEARQRTLAARDIVPQAQFESAQQARASALATVRGAEANLSKASDQLTYARLRADMDGVVTAVGAQVGQVVTAGQSVVTIARPDIRDAAVDMPEDLARDLKPGAGFDVALQLDPTIHMAGEVREVAPQADAATRTRRVLITLTNAASVFRLGTMITAAPMASASPMIVLPRSALLEKDGKTFVWIVDPATATVTPREIAAVPRGEAAFQVTEGLTPGVRVVTAGVHALTAGQRVKLPNEAPPEGTR